FPRLYLVRSGARASGTFAALRGSQLAVVPPERGWVDVESLAQPVRRSNCVAGSCPLDHHIDWREGPFESEILNTVRVKRKVFLEIGAAAILRRDAPSASARLINRLRKKPIYPPSEISERGCIYRGEEAVGALLAAVDIAVGRSG